MVTLTDVLERHRRLGLLGSAAVSEHLAQGRAVASVVREAPTGLLIELGSGGGVPGLVLVDEAVADAYVLVERRARRADALLLAVTELAWSDRVDVVSEDAGVVARGPRRGRADVVVARSFGPPAVTAEYGAPLLRPGGRLVVTGRPDPPEWPSAGLAEIGLGPLRWRTVDGWVVGVSEVMGSVPDSLPRRGSAPRRRPLFEVG